jgi:hypothetical protein
VYAIDALSGAEKTEAVGLRGKGCRPTEESGRGMFTFRLIPNPRPMLLAGVPAMDPPLMSTLFRRGVREETEPGRGGTGGGGEELRE